MTAIGRITSATMVFPTVAVYILLHTRPSWCLRVSPLTNTFVCHAWCIKLSKIVLIAVTRMGTQSIFIDVRLSAGLYEMLSWWKVADSNRLLNPGFFGETPYAPGVRKQSPYSICRFAPLFPAFSSQLLTRQAKSYLLYRSRMALISISSAV